MTQDTAATKKLYEVVNPSDSGTFYAPSIEVAAVAMLLLDGGRGLYAARAVDGSDSSPLFAFAGTDWLKQRGMIPLSDWIDAHINELKAALESVALGDANDRADFDDAIETMAEADRAAFIKRRNDRRRSSMNDFESRAHEVARSIHASKENDAT